MTTDELRSWMKALEERDVRIAALEKTVAALSRSEPPKNPPQRVYCDAQGREWHCGSTHIGVDFGADGGAVRSGGGGAGGISSNTFGSSSGGVAGCGGGAFLPTPEEQIALGARSGLDPAQAVGYPSVLLLAEGLMGRSYDRVGDRMKAAFKACLEQGLFASYSEEWRADLRANGWPL